MSFYQLHDSGNFQKLESLGPYLIQRPCAQALWEPLYPERWKGIDAHSKRSKDGGGTWTFYKPQAQEWVGEISVNTELSLKTKIKLTPFGHCGIFLEQAPLWNLIHTKRPLKFLNLFAYTGMASLAASAAGAEVFHVDSSKGALEWAKENAELNGLSPNMHFVHQDAMKFLEHSVRKGFRYDGILADPPSWGHGAKKEKWNFEEQIGQFVKLLSEVSAPQGFLILTAHTPGVSPQALHNLLSPYQKSSQTLEAGNLSIPHAHDPRLLPSGIFASLGCHVLFANPAR